MSNFHYLRNFKESSSNKKNNQIYHLRFNLNKLNQEDNQYNKLNSDRKSKNKLMLNRIYQTTNLSFYNKDKLKPKQSFPLTNILTSCKEYKKKDQLEQFMEQYKNQKIKAAKHFQKEICKSMFVFLYVVGKGGFGKVWKVKQKKTGKIYAMKQMSKAKVIQKKSVKSVLNERQLITKLYHPFLVNMKYAFQDRQNLYLTIDYINGGDLRYHISRRIRFSQIQTSKIYQQEFFIACIITGLQYLHMNGIIHRDIKPQNLVLQSNGYVRITDLGISRENRFDNAEDTSGTPGYMCIFNQQAPEVICRQNHSYQSDFFAVGVIAYEFMFGRRPYVGKSRKQIRDHILSKQVFVRSEDLPPGWSFQAADFINGLIQRKPGNRLGYRGITQIKVHRWYKGFEWNRLYRKQLRSPFIPKSIEQNYNQYKKQISQDTIIQNPQQTALFLRNQQVQSLFDGYQWQLKKKSTNSTYYTSQEENKYFFRK